MKKLHMKVDGQWFPVFAISAQTSRIILCPEAPHKALPQQAHWGPDDLAYFRRKYADREFDLRTASSVR